MKRLVVPMLLAVACCALATTLAPAPASALECSCNTSLRFTTNATGQGSTCAFATDNLGVLLYTAADAHCVSLGYDLSCYPMTSYGSCSYSGGKYRRSGSLTYSCASCWEIDNP